MAWSALQVQFMEDQMLNGYSRYSAWNTKFWYMGTPGTVHGTLYVGTTGTVHGTQYVGK